MDYDLLQFVKIIHDMDSKEIKLLNPIKRELKVKKAPIVSGNTSTIGTKFITYVPDNTSTTLRWFEIGR